MRWHFYRAVPLVVLRARRDTADRCERLGDHRQRRASRANQQRRPDIHADLAIRRHPVADPVVRLSIEVVEAHRALAGGFGRVALDVAPPRVFCELNLSGDKTAYEVLVILYSAHPPPHDRRASTAGGRCGAAHAGVAEVPLICVGDPRKGGSPI